MHSAISQRRFPTLEGIDTLWYGVHWYVLSDIRVELFVGRHSNTHCDYKDVVVQPQVLWQGWKNSVLHSRNAFSYILPAERRVRNTVY